LFHKTNLKIGKCAFSVAALTIWNQLPIINKSSETTAPSKGGCFGEVYRSYACTRTNHVSSPILLYHIKHPFCINNTVINLPLHLLKTKESEIQKEVLLLQNGKR